MTTKLYEPALIGLDDVEAAARRIAGQARRTPLVATLLGRPDAPVHLKAESLQLGGSFKFRGALNAVAQLTESERARGVLTHSSGNHAQGLARAAQALGLRATIVMPTQSPAVKVQATRALGADVVLVDAAERASTVERLQAETGAVFVPPYDHPAIIAGQGTVGLEICADLPDVATVWVPVSGGGLVSGIATAVKALSPGVRVIAVEPELAGDLAAGWAAGERVVWDSDRTGRTIADGLRTQSVGVLNWHHIRDRVDEVVTVSEDDILAAMRDIMIGAKLVAEPSGAVALAGWQRHAARLDLSGPAVAVVSGGNVEPALLREVLQ